MPKVECPDCVKEVAFGTRLHIHLKHPGSGYCHEHKLHRQKVYNARHYKKSKMNMFEVWEQEFADRAAMLREQSELRPKPEYVVERWGPPSESTGPPED